MTLGQRLRQARQEKGLSQTQVAGSHMTRNMLSQLENDLAYPSVQTLLYLADTLGVRAGWLLGEEQGQRQDRLEEIRRSYENGAYESCVRRLLELPGEQTEEEGLLLCRSALACAKESCDRGSAEEAERFLQYASQIQCIYVGPWERMQLQVLRCRCAFLRGKADPEQMERLQNQMDQLEPCSAAELLWVQYDLLTGQAEQAQRRLDCVRLSGSRQKAEALLLRGWLLTEQKQFDRALDVLHQAERSELPGKQERLRLYRLLELCYKQREDYRMAYRYASLRLDEN